ncbi:MAG: glycine cleavage system protein GcvH [Planctomycetes bacterium]|nr:glycine cleavage system protein GcvH [Planctomycetota bacterium]
MAEVRYAQSHEWARLEDDGSVTCGITQHAADELNELTFLEYRVAEGDTVTQGQEFGEIDSVKSTSPLNAPVDGTVLAINARFENEDDLPAINASPQDEGWLIKIQPSDSAQHASLLDEAAYQEHCGH